MIGRIYSNENGHFSIGKYWVMHFLSDAGQSLLLVNFGGPRHLDEISPFLQALLCDRDVIRTKLPSFLHHWIFGRLARKRAQKVRHDYAAIGGKSPIYFDTESIAQGLRERLKIPVYTFHRYLPATHAESLQQIEKAQKLIALPLFPQFCFATTGSIARFLSCYPMLWIKSYADHPAFINSYQKKIRDFLVTKGLREEETILFFSAHGVPKKFVEEGDPYETECALSFQRIARGFPAAKSVLAYQSKFGRGEWLQPYTDVTCETVLQWREGRKNVVFVPMSFVSDHIETLFEIEKLYLPIIARQGICAYRCPALNLEPYWLDALAEIACTPSLFSSETLIRKDSF